jgi:LPS-assembly protein
MAAGMLDGSAVAAARATPMRVAPTAAKPDQILLQADQIIYDTKARIVTAKGHVEIADDTRVLLADQVSYDEAKDLVTADGHVSLQDENGNVAFADHVELTQDLREGALQGLSALIGPNGRLAAQTGQRIGGRYLVADGAVFTPCKICRENGDRMPLWQVRAARVVHDAVNHEIYFDDAVFEFLGTPVLFLPFFSEADPTVTRKSGVLLPEVGSSSYLGSYLKVPYYITLNPSQDLTVDPFLTTRAGVVLQTEYRQRWDNGGGLWLQGTLGYDPGAVGKPGESEWVSSLFGSGRIPLTDTWRAGFDVQLTSNETYLKRYEISYADRLTSDIFTDDVEGRSRMAATAYFFQSLRATDVTAQVPLALPVLEYTYIPDSKVWGGRLKIDTSALMLTRDVGTNLTRGSADVDWRRPFITDDGQLITFESFLRSDLYYVTDAQFDVPTATKNTETIGRALGLAMLEWRYPFVGTVGLPDTTVVFEPIVQLIGATVGGNPSNLPDEDSTTFEFDETNLFNPNLSPGLDLWTGGPRSNVGGRVSAILPHGYVEATLGEDFRLLPDPSLPPGSGVDGTKSDTVGQFKFEFPPNISLTDQFSIDPRDGTIRRNEVYLRAKLGRSSVDLSYLKLPASAADPTIGEQEQINLNATVVLFGNWGVFGEERRDLAKNQNLESAIGIKYEDDCFVAELGFQRRDTATLNLKASSDVIFRLGLKSGLTGG